jgi:hypothetical protein
MPTMNDTILTIRCPYCMAGIDFRPMIAHKDGRFVCRDRRPHAAPRLADARLATSLCSGAELSLSRVFSNSSSA